MRFILSILFLSFFCTISSVNAQTDNSEFDILTKKFDSLEKKIEQLNQIIEQNTNQILSSSDEINDKLISNENNISNIGLELNSTLTVINETIMKNQIHDDELQLMYTLAQVSGVFIAIMGGFFTTKMLSLSTEKNRIQRKINEICSELKGKKSIHDHYKGIIDFYENKWAKRKIQKFKYDYLFKLELKKYSKQEILELFSKFKNDEYGDQEINEYERNLLNDDYNSIINEINKKLEDIKKQEEERIKDLKKGIIHLPFSLSISPSLFNIDTIINEEKDYEEYDIAYEKLKTIDSEIKSLEDQQKNLRDELNDIILPNSLNLGLFLLFTAIIVGIFIPLFYSFLVETVPFWATIGFIGFLISILITFYYFGFELKRELYGKQVKTDQK